MWRTTWKGLMGHKLRLVLTAIAIVLGVGFVAGTYVLTDTMNAAFTELFGQTSQASDMIVRAEAAFEAPQAGPGGGGGGSDRDTLPAALLDDVRAVDGVAVADGDVQGYAQLVNPDTDEPIGGVGPPTIGLNWTELSEGVLVARAGGPPTAAGQVAIDAGTATDNGLTVGETVKVLFQGPPEEFEIVGIYGFGETDNLAGATLAIFETATAQRVLDREGVYDTITVKTDEGTDVRAVQLAVGEVVPEGVEVLSSADVADEQADALQEGLGFFRTALLVFAAIALFVGAFIIFNTFSILVAQRTRELALLRTLGASPRQVVTSVMLEAVVVGFVASLLGIVAGLAIASGLQGLLGAFGIDLPSTSTQLQPRTIVVSLVLGIGVTVIASIVPARHAAKVAPIQALRADLAPAERGQIRRRAIVGGIVSVLGIGALASGLFGSTGSSAELVGLGAALTFVGVAVLSPLVAKPIAGGIGAPFGRRSVAARLGRENAIRNPRRTASTASALMIGLGLVAMVAILAASLKASFDATLQELLRADVTLSTTSFTPFSTDVATQVAALPEVGAAASFRQNGFRIEGSDSFLTGFDPATFDAVASVGAIEGSLADLGGDTIAVRVKVADERGWSLGSQVPAAFASSGDRPLTIVAIYEEGGLLGDYAIDLTTYEELYSENLDSFVLVKAAEGVAATDLQRVIEQALASDFPSIQVQDQAAFRESQAAFINQLLGLVTALLFMAIIIAVFGIINTLGLSIYERTRELGLLRAVGMGRRQVKRMIRYESVIIALFGAFLGIVVGIGFGWALQRALEPEGIDKLSIPVGQLVFYVLFAALTGVLAAIWPARKAAKLNVLEAISYE